MMHASSEYAAAVPNVVAQTKAALLQANLNYQEDLNEVAAIILQKLAGREKEIGDGWANIYANEFSEQELKDLVAFYKSPLGRKWLGTQPMAIQSCVVCMTYMFQWNQDFAKTVDAEFRAEMKQRGKPI
jgi:hypothetical protein